MGALLKLRHLAVAALFGGSVAACFSGCKSPLKYRNDFGFLVSAQANSPEFPVRLNGSLCVDSDRRPGLCAKRVRSSETIRISFEPQTYAYLVTLTCTSGVKVPPPGNVIAGEPFSFTLSPDDFREFKSFTCIGEISPQDREAPVSASFRAHFVVVDANYAEREAAYLTARNGKTYLVLGQFARSARVFDQGRWRLVEKRPIVEVKGDPEKVAAYSESYAMRFNFLNMDALSHE